MGVVSATGKLGVVALRNRSSWAAGVWLVAVATLLFSGLAGAQEEASGKSDTEKTSDEWFAEGMKRYEAGKVDEAIFAFKKVVALDAENAKAYYNIGWLYQSKGKDYFDIAAKWYKKALEKDKKMLNAYYNLGVIAYLKDDYKQALQYFEICYALDPKDQQVQAALRKVRGKAPPAAPPRGREETQKEAGKRTDGIIRRLLTAADVVDREPSDARNRFSARDEKVFCFVEFNDLSGEKKVTFNWIGPDGEKDYVYERPVEFPGGRYRFWVYRTCGQTHFCNTRGNWKIEVLLDGEKVGEHKFTIE